MDNQKKSFQDRLAERRQRRMSAMPTTMTSNDNNFKENMALMDITNNIQADSNMDSMEAKNNLTNDDENSSHLNKS